MVKLIYAAITSLDGYITDENRLFLTPVVIGGGILALPKRVHL